MKIAWQYIRKSNEDQSNFSISGQDMLNQEWARKNDIRIVRTFVDDGYSAKDFNRPQWKELQEAISKSKIDYLIVMKYDRLIRNVIQGLSFVEKLEEKWKIVLISVMENYSIDPHDPYFFKHRADMFVDADFERRRIADRTKFGIWSGKTQGRFLGKAPYGYINGKDNSVPIPKPILITDQSAKLVVENIFADFIADVPFPVILSKARKNGFKLSGKECIKRIILNPVYAGLIAVNAYKDNDKRFAKGLHEGFIAEDVFWSAYYKLKGQIKPIIFNPLDENLPLRGFLLCPNCSVPHTGAKCKGKLKYYWYYWCNKCRGKNYGANKVHSDIDLILKGLSLSSNYLKAIQIEAEIKLNESTSERRIHLQRVVREHLEIKEKLTVMEEKYFSNKIDDSTYKKWHFTYTQALLTKNEERNALRQSDEVILNLYKESLPYLSDLNYIYKETPIEDKQIFLKSVFPGCLTTIEGGYRTPFLPKIFSVNSASLKGLVEIEKERESSFSERFPVGVGTGSEIKHFFPKNNELETLLKFIDKIMRKAA